MTIRYWRSLHTGNIVPSPRHGSEQGFLLHPEDWEEVIVLEKPRPKTWTRKVAIYSGELGREVCLELYKKSWDKERISDAVEVTFTERQD